MDNTFDRMFYSEGELIAGMDESGVSDIAGPLVAACVVLPKLDPRVDDVKIFEVCDSKKIPEKYRKQHAEVIWQTAIGIGIGEVQPVEIDYLTKHTALSLAMLRAVAACRSPATGKPVRPDFLIVDAPVSAPVTIRQAVIKDADEKSLCSASASIVAKVYRDEIMLKLHEQFPFYDWISNKGYPCAAHFEGLDKHGVQVGIHRLRYWPFRKNANLKEDASVDWEQRRKQWIRFTAQALNREVGEGLWTSKPQLWRPSQGSRSSPSKARKTGRSLTS